MRNLIALFLAIIGLLLAGCAGEQQLDSATVTATLEEHQAHAKRVEDLLQTLDANREGMEYPLRAQTSNLGDLIPSNSFSELPEERQLAIKASFNNYVGKLDAHRQALTPLLQQLKEIERDLRMLLTSLEEPDNDGAASPEYAQIRERLSATTTAINEQETKVLATQDEIVAYLNSDDFMSSGVPQIIVNSPTM